MKRAREALQRVGELGKQILGRRSFWVRALLLPGLVLLWLVVLPIMLVGPSEKVPSAEKNAADSLQMLQAFLQQRLEIASLRQVALVVDLPARRLALEVAGLPVREVSILGSHLAIPPALRQIATTTRPFVGQTYRASIPRYPITVVEAPSDTLQAQQQPPIWPPQEDSGGVWVYLEFDRGLELWLLSPPASLGERLERWCFVGHTRLWREVRWLYRLLWQRPATLPVPIVLELPPADIRAIFRALPDSARLALRY